MTGVLRRAAAVTASALVLFAVQPALASAAARPPAHPTAHHAPPGADVALPVRAQFTYSGHPRALVSSD